MLGYEYLKYNGVVLPPPTGFKISYENIENINSSEAGSKIGTVTALGLRTFNCSWGVSSFWFKKLLAIGNTASGNLTVNNETIKVMARLNSADLVEDSELTPNTNGLYNISLSFAEVDNANS